MSLDTDLQAYVTFNAQCKMEMNKISEQTSVTPNVFYCRAPSHQDLLLSGSPSFSEENYDVEVYGEDIDAVESLAQTLINLLHGYRGNIGLTYCHAVMVSDHAQDYQSKVLMNTDAGLHVSTFSLQIIH